MLTRCDLHIYTTLLYRFHHRCRHCDAARIIVSFWLPCHKPTGGSEPLLPLCSRLLLKNWNTANSTVRLNSDANPCKSPLRCDLFSKKSRTAKVWCHVHKSGRRGDSQQLLLARALCVTLERPQQEASFITVGRINHERMLSQNAA